MSAPPTHWNTAERTAVASIVAPAPEALRHLADLLDDDDSLVLIGAWWMPDDYLQVVVARDVPATPERNQP